MQSTSHLLPTMPNEFEVLRSLSKSIKSHPKLGVQCGTYFCPKSHSFFNHYFRSLVDPSTTLCVCGMYTQRPECLNTSSASLNQESAIFDYNYDQEPDSSNLQSSPHQMHTVSAIERQRKKSAFGDISENLIHSEIFHKYNCKFIGSALALFRDEEDVLRPFLRLSYTEKVGIARILRSNPKELGAILDISAEDEYFIEEFKEYNGTDTQEIFERLGKCFPPLRKFTLKDMLDSHVGTLQDPLAPPTRCLQTCPLSCQQSSRTTRALHVPSNLSASMLLTPTETPRNAGKGNQFPTFCCTYSCGGTFQKEGHRNNHELNHHDGKRRITCQHVGCKVEVATEPGYVVHHNRKHKPCKTSTSCIHSENVRPPKTASSCGYCGKLFQGESNFTARGEHITKKHHKPKDPKDCKTTKEWSRNVQLEGNNGTEGMFSRPELAGWIDFKEKRTQLHGVSNLCWEKAPEEKWEKLLELIEHGAVIDDGPQWGFPADVVRNIFEETYNLAVPQSSRSTPLQYPERATYLGVEPSAYHLNPEMSHKDATWEHFLSDLDGHGERSHVGDDPNSSSYQHKWTSVGHEGPCISCEAISSIYYMCSECHSNRCGNCYKYPSQCERLNAWMTHCS